MISPTKYHPDNKGLYLPVLSEGEVQAGDKLLILHESGAVFTSTCKSITKRKASSRTIHLEDGRKIIEHFLINGGSWAKKISVWRTYDDI